MKFRNLLQLGIVTFAVSLAVVVGYQLSSEAMAVVVGVVCGVLASVPMSAMILVMTRRQLRPAAHKESVTPVPHQQPYAPPVVVIQPDGRQAHSPLPSPWETEPAAAEQQPWRRSFTVVGDDEEWE